MKLQIGQRIRVASCSGIDSNKTGTIISWEDSRVNEIRNKYPFNGGRTPQGMKWIAILLDTELIVVAFPEKRIVPLRTSKTGDKRNENN